MPEYLVIVRDGRQSPPRKLTTQSAVHAGDMIAADNDWLYVDSVWHARATTYLVTDVQAPYTDSAPSV